MGILNGCKYSRKTSIKKPARAQVADTASENILAWASLSRQMKSSHWLADKRVEELKRSRKSRFIVTSVGRITEQKARLFHTRLPGGRFALEEILKILGDEGLFILLGSGDVGLEDFITRMAGKYDNLLFLNGYSDELSAQIYAYGDLFLMPSSYEPCGISQMLAMRAGQACLVNAVGGLKDTVIDGETGFVFSGENIQTQAESLIKKLTEAFSLYKQDPDSWSGIRYRASQQRFTWKKAAKQYLSQLY